jgi:hypothetical protein
MIYKEYVALSLEAKVATLLEQVIQKVVIPL